jgi:DNA-binding response OmpR family regulator
VSKQSLLLVDGDARSLRVLEVSLRKAGFTVTTAINGPDALEKLALASPDLVISETKLDDMDGFELCKQIKANAVWAEIPFVFLTANTGIEHKVKGLELGVDDYLTKPIYIKEVVTRLQILLQKRQRTRIEERQDGRTRFVGRLSDMAVVDLIQTIEISRKSGVIQFTGEGGRQAAIYFRDGKVVDAEAGPLQGEDAVYRLLTWNDGAFEVVFRTVRRRDVITTPSQGLLMEGMRRLDEWTRLCEQLPSLETRFEVDTLELAQRLGDIPDENNSILKLMDGRRTLHEVIDAGSVGDLECLQAVSRLFFEGLLVEQSEGRAATSRSGIAGVIAEESSQWVVPATVFDETPVESQPIPGRRGDSGPMVARIVTVPAPRAREGSGPRPSLPPPPPPGRRASGSNPIPIARTDRAPSSPPIAETRRAPTNPPAAQRRTPSTPPATESGGARRTPSTPPATESGGARRTPSTPPAMRTDSGRVAAAAQLTDSGRIAAPPLEDVDAPAPSDAVPVLAGASTSSPEVDAAVAELAAAVAELDAGPTPLPPPPASSVPIAVASAPEPRSGRTTPPPPPGSSERAKRSSSQPHATSQPLPLPLPSHVGTEPGPSPVKAPLAARSEEIAPRHEEERMRSPSGEMEVGALSGTFRPSSLRKIDEAVAAAQLISPELFADDDLPTLPPLAPPAAGAPAIAQEPEAPVIARTTSPLLRPMPDGPPDPEPGSSPDDFTEEPSYVFEMDLGAVPDEYLEDEERKSRPASGIATGRAKTVSDRSGTEPGRPSREMTTSNPRILASHGADQAQVSGELELPSRASEWPEKETTARELVTIKPRRITREMPAVVPSPELMAEVEAAAASMPRTSAAMASTKIPVVATAVERAKPSSRPRAGSGTSKSMTAATGGVGGLPWVLGAIGLALLAAAYMRCFRTPSTAPAVATSDAAVGPIGLETPDAAHVAVASAPDARPTPDAAHVAVASAPDARPTPDAAHVAVAPAPDARPMPDARTGPDYRKLREDAQDALDDNNPELAIELADKSYAISKSGRTLVIKADALRRLGAIDEAIETIDTAITRDPEYANAYETKGRILWGARRIDEARAAYEKYLQLKPTGAMADRIRTLLGQ